MVTEAPSTGALSSRSCEHACVSQLRCACLHTCAPADRKHRHTHTHPHVCTHTQTRVHTHAPGFTGILGSRLLWPLQALTGVKACSCQAGRAATRSGSPGPASRRTRRSAQAHGPARGPALSCAGYWRTPDAHHSKAQARAPHAPLSHGPTQPQSLCCRKTWRECPGPSCRQA